MDNIKNILDKINYILAATAKSRTGKVPKKYKIKYTPVSGKEKLTRLLNTDYSAAYEKYLAGNGIFRGVRNNTLDKVGKYSVLSPGLKVSEDVKFNLYTRLFSGILPSWKGYPPRNRSFICTSSTGKALEFTDTFPALDEWKNNVYAVLPKNGAVIGVCPKSDLWFAFQQ